MPSEKGSGDAIQSWNSDQAKAVYITTLAAIPLGLRPPVSASSTICWSCSPVNSNCFDLASLTENPLDELL